MVSVLVCCCMNEQPVSVNAAYMSTETTRGFVKCLRHKSRALSIQARKSQLEINMEVEVVQAVVDVDGLFGSICLVEKRM